MTDLHAFFEAHKEPGDPAEGEVCRCSVILTDGVELPCVVLKQAAPRVASAITRLEEERAGNSIVHVPGDSYIATVLAFTALESQISPHQIAAVRPSSYAIPWELMNRVEGETLMGWTAWVFEMTDGALFPYATSFSCEFFGLPEGYTFEDVARVHSGAYVNAAGGLAHVLDDVEGYWEAYEAGTIPRPFENRPYFTCYFDADLAEADLAR